MEEAEEAREELKLFLLPSSAFTWNKESGAERVESTNTEYTNGTEARESQEVTLHSSFEIPFCKIFTFLLKKVADLKASVMSMQAEFNLQLSALRFKNEILHIYKTVCFFEFVPELQFFFILYYV